MRGSLSVCGGGRRVLTATDTCGKRVISLVVVVALLNKYTASQRTAGHLAENPITPPGEGRPAQPGAGGVGRERSPGSQKLAKHAARVRHQPG
jgi:hypothetical protein